ncbi:competence protein CoiA family protein [Segatella copri]|uniref:competence protein CoiA family protein n=1 Tax=Segatella copri TaxID=165179 RepID=UPI001C4603D6|nr:competence protein CoiA family protein [Segatella copri]MBW0021456.1 hypothetical protein [Segatella copri]MBW0036171.1 hypothetical protein [Segatella copri]
MDAYLTYAVGEKGHLVHVDDVPNGEACDCTCPECRSKLIAKNKGQHNQHHFAHVGGSDCVGAVESALHLMAKEILSEGKKIMLPRYPLQVGGVRLFKSIEVESYDKELSLRPDCVGDTAGQKLWVEFKRSHEVDTDKAAKIKSAKIECVEIDINACPLDPLKMKEFLEESSENRQWIYFKGQESSKSEHTSYSHISKDYSFSTGYLNTPGRASNVFLGTPEDSKYHIVTDENNSKVINLRTLSFKDFIPSIKYRCIACKQEVIVKENEVGYYYFVHKEGKNKCSYSLYLKEAAKALIKQKFADREKKFYIAPSDKLFDLKSYGYTECIDGSSIKDFEYDLVITRKGKISDNSIYILLDEKGNSNYSMPGNHYRTIIVPINEESIMLNNICYNDQLNAPGIKYFNFNLKVDKKEGNSTFTLYADGHYDFSYNTKNDKPQPSAVFKMEFVSEFDNEREAKEFAVLKCLEENRKVCPCIVCSNFDEYNGGCLKSCKIGDIPCKDFIMYKFIRTSISSKYKDAKVKVTSLTSAKDEGTLELI